MCYIHFKPQQRRFQCVLRNFLTEHLRVTFAIVSHVKKRSRTFSLKHFDFNPCHVIEVVVRGVLQKRCFKIFTKLTGKHTCARVSFFNKVAGQACNFIKKRVWHSCFPVNFVKFLRTLFSIEYVWWLLMKPLVSFYTP